MSTRRKQAPNPEPNTQQASVVQNEAGAEPQVRKHT
jgi:hypothetical protein